jgi:hypothetical protein
VKAEDVAAAKESALSVEAAEKLKAAVPVAGGDAGG